MEAHYTKVDLETWPRRDHYRYYTQILKVECNVVAEVQVDHLLDYCHKNGYKFYPALICLVTRVVNSMENLRLFRNEQDELCLWDYVVPNYTFFHEDDKTFSDCWSEYDPDFDTFYRNIVSDMERYKDVKGIKAKPGQPANFYCISGEPWVKFTGFGAKVADGEPQFFPVITMGKYETENGKTMMPVNIMVAHAACDGYHIGLFFETLQKELDHIGLS